MFIALAFCYLPPFIFFYFGWKASKSGSMVKQQKPGVPNIYEWVKSDQNVPFVKTAQFIFGLLWVLLGTIFFWALLWPDHHDVWFITK
jgi:hypothetical protein